MNKLFVFEGIDGAGKTSLIKWLMSQEYFQQDTISLREPGGDADAEKIRGLIMGNKNFTSLAEMLLFQAARAQVVGNIIKPAIQENKIILLDRFVQSTMAYQLKEGVSKQDIVWANKIATQGVIPRLVILLDGRPDILRTREVGERNKYDEKSIEYYESIRNSYIDMAYQSYFAKRYIIVNTEDHVEKVRQIVFDEITRQLQFDAIAERRK